MMFYGYKKDERMQIKNVFHFQNATANRKEKKEKEINTRQSLKRDTVKPRLPSLMMPRS